MTTRKRNKLRRRGEASQNIDKCIRKGYSDTQRQLLVSSHVPPPHSSMSHLFVVVLKPQERFSGFGFAHHGRLIHA